MTKHLQTTLPRTNEILGGHSIAIPSTRFESSENSDQGYHPECGAVDGGQILVDDLHESLLEAEQALREIDEQLLEPLTLNRSLTELRATADAYARLGSEHRNSGG